MPSPASACFLFLAALSPVAAIADPACDRIDAVYSSCGTKYHFDGSTFRFETSSGPETVACHDGLNLPYFDRLDRMDIRSIFLFPYTSGPVPLPETRLNWDPGRLRSEPMFKSVFGHDESSVRENLVPVPFLGQVIKFQKRLGAAAALKRVGEELMAEAGRDKSLADFLAPFTKKKQDLRYYGFFWRNVKGTTRLSSHSFGTAIDLLTETPFQYWLWDEQKAHPDKAARGETAYRNDHFIPAGAPQFHPKAVEIFERNGFIWGGKWNHYDTMHFEYRPEFFASAVVDCSEQREPLFSDAADLGDFGPLEADH